MVQPSAVHIVSFFCSFVLSLYSFAHQLSQSGSGVGEGVGKGVGTSVHSQIKSGSPASPSKPHPSLEFLWLHEFLLSSYIPTQPIPWLEHHCSHVVTPPVRSGLM